MTDKLLTIGNDGPLIVKTNYWETEPAEKGFIYLSINAGCFRLLVPKGKGISLDELRTASVVLVSRGPWPSMNKPDGLELLFEDGSDRPYCLHVAIEQCDRIPLERDRDRKGQPPKWKFAVYNQDGLQFECPARYRLVKRIPWMKEWWVWQVSKNPNNTF